MSLAACGEKVRRGDPDRFLSAMTAPPGLRARLLVLYAFNLELARAPLVANEATIAEMRLQFWADTIADMNTGQPPRAHEVAAPLADLVRETGLDNAVLSEMVTARRFDLYREPHRDLAAFERYIDRTSGHLMWLAARSLGASPELESDIRDFAWGAGVAALLRAVPDLQALGRAPLIDATPGGIIALADLALGKMNRARRAQRHMPKALLPALLAGWRAGSTLHTARRDPGAVARGGLEESPFRRKFALLWRDMLGRW